LDNLCHTLTGWALARAGLDRAAAGDARGRVVAATILLVVASNFPDADLVIAWLGPERYILWHRGLTHAVLGLAIFPPALAFLAAAIAPSLGFPRALLLAEIGAITHILMDIPTAWGTLALFPWSHARVALNWVFIVDPILWLLPLGGIALGFRKARRGRSRPARLGLALSVAYVLGAGGLHEWARERFRDRLTADGGKVGDVQVYPRPLAPWRWLAVGWRGDSLEIAELQGLPARVTDARAEANGLGDATVQNALMTRAGQSFLWWAGAPEARVVLRDSTRAVVRLTDRRFAMRAGDPFEMEIVLDSSGAYLEAAWEGKPVFRR
jgi:inner membrane protein